MQTNPMQKLKDAMKKGIPFLDMIEVVLGPSAIGNGIITNQDGRDFFITEIINSSYITASRLPANDFLFQITDTGSNYQLSYTGIHASCLGSNKVPTKFDIPYVLRATADMQFNFTNNSATPITVQLIVKGYKIAKSTLSKEMKEMGTVFWDMFKVDPSNSIPLAASQSLKGLISNKDEKTFLIQEYTGFSKLSGSAQTFAFRSYFRDSASRQAFAQKPISGGAIGNGEFPTRFEVPYPLRSQNQFECEASNDLSGDSQSVYIVMKGVKIP